MLKVSNSILSIQRLDVLILSYINISLDWNSKSYNWNLTVLTHVILRIRKGSHTKYVHFEGGGVLEVVTKHTFTM